MFLTKSLFSDEKTEELTDFLINISSVLNLTENIGLKFSSNIKEDEHNSNCEKNDFFTLEETKENIFYLYTLDNTSYKTKSISLELRISKISGNSFLISLETSLNEYFPSLFNKEDFKKEDYCDLNRSSRTMFISLNDNLKEVVEFLLVHIMNSTDWRSDIYVLYDVYENYLKSKNLIAKTI